MSAQVDDRGRNLDEEEPNATKDKEKEELLITYVKEVLQAESSREEIAARRNQNLTIILGFLISQMIHDHLMIQDDETMISLVYGFHEVNEMSPNLSTILERISRNCYNNTTEVLDDVVTVFEIAMKKCDENSRHMAKLKFLLRKFEYKSRDHIVQSIIEEEMQSNETSQAQLEMQLLCAKIYQFKEIDAQLEELKDQVLRKCGKMDIEEKKRILFDIKTLSPDEIINAMMIVAKNNDICFDPTTEFIVWLNEDDTTLWELMFFLKDKRLRVRQKIVV